MTYRDGLKIHCPACGLDSVVKTVTKMDGWKAAGRFFVCALCGNTLGPAADPGEQTNSRSEAARAAAARLLGGPEEDDGRIRIRRRLESTTRRFCKDCRHFFRHPFKTTCLLHEREVDPMGDCPSHEPRPAAANQDGSAKGTSA